MSYSERDFEIKVHIHNDATMLMINIDDNSNGLVIELKPEDLKEITDLFIDATALSECQKSKYKTKTEPWTI
jgi:hypothetical protein